MKLGRLPARPTDPKLPLAAYLDRSQLPAPPREVDWAPFVSDFGMLGNDTLGDCVPAGILHSAQIATAIIGNEFVPTEAEAVKLYEAVGHYVPGDPATDQGAVMFDAMDHLVTHGFMGHKAKAFASLVIDGLEEVKAACHLFGPIPIGIMLPASAEQQFAAGQPWDLTFPRSHILGGHCVVICGYTDAYFQIVTWGKVVPATPAFIQAVTDEAYAILSDLWFKDGKAPNALRYQALLDDFNALPRARA